jgi:hypothetical protein
MPLFPSHSRYHPNEFSRLMRAIMAFLKGAQDGRGAQLQDRLPVLFPVGEECIEALVGERVLGKISEHRRRHGRDIGPC